MKVLIIVFTSLLIILFAVNSVLASEEKDTLKIFSNQNFSVEAINFEPNQKIYVQIVSQNPGEDERMLRILDSNYSEVTEFQLTRSGTSPYSYKTSFNAPSSEEYYSLEATIKNDSQVTKLVKTIKVGNPDDSKIKVDIKNQILGEETNSSEKNINSNVGGENNQSVDNQSSGSNQGSGETFSDYQFTNDNKDQSFWQEFKNLFSGIIDFFIRIF